MAGHEVSQYLIRQVGGAPYKDSMRHTSNRVSIPYSSGRGGARTGLAVSGVARVSIPYSSGRGGAPGRLDNLSTEHVSIPYSSGRGGAPLL